MTSMDEGDSVHGTARQSDIFEDAAGDVILRCTSDPDCGCPGQKDLYCAENICEKSGLILC